MILFVLAPACMLAACVLLSSSLRVSYGAVAIWSFASLVGLLALALSCLLKCRIHIAAWIRNHNIFIRKKFNKNSQWKANALLVFCFHFAKSSTRTQYQILIVLEICIVYYFHTRRK